MCEKIPSMNGENLNQSAAGSLHICAVLFGPYFRSLKSYIIEVHCHIKSPHAVILHVNCTDEKRTALNLNSLQVTYMLFALNNFETFVLLFLY